MKIKTVTANKTTKTTNDLYPQATKHNKDYDKLGWK